MRPFSSKASSTTSSFSMRWWWRSSFASSMVTPTRAVTRSFVITCSTRCSRFRSKRRSRLVRMPTSRPCWTTGMPLMPFSRMSASAWWMRRVRLDGDRVGDHRGLVLLHLHDLGGLLLDGEVLVDEADAARRRHGDGHARLGDGVHRRGDDRDVEGEVAGEAGRGLDGLREDVRLGRKEQDVVERERQSQIVAVEHADVYAKAARERQGGLAASPAG